MQTLNTGKLRYVSNYIVKQQSDCVQYNTQSTGMHNLFGNQVRVYEFHVYYDGCILEGNSIKAFYLVNRLDLYYQ